MPPLGSKNAINFLHKFVYPLLLLFWISLVICRVNKEPFLYSLRVEEREATSVPNSGTLVIGMHGLRPRAVLLVAVSPLVHSSLLKLRALLQWTLPKKKINSRG